MGEDRVQTEVLEIKSETGKKIPNAPLAIRVFPSLGGC